MHSSCTDQREKLLVAYIETGNTILFYLKYIPEVLQDPLKGKESGYQIITIIMLLCFMLDKASQHKAIIGILFSIYLVLCTSLKSL